MEAALRPRSTLVHQVCRLNVTLNVTGRFAPELPAFMANIRSVGNDPLNATDQRSGSGHLEICKVTKIVKKVAKVVAKVATNHTVDVVAGVALGVAAAVTGVGAVVEGAIAGAAAAESAAAVSAATASNV